jgi:type III secretion protein S
MDPLNAVEVARQGLYVVIAVTAPFVIGGTLIGLLVAIAQAVTQIQDQTLGQAVRLLTTLLGLAMAGGWACAEVLEFAQRVFSSLPGM